MAFSIRPAVRENTPLIIGIAGPSKSGKTYSAHRIARGLANGGRIVMLNAEGKRGHQYADTFKYDACDIEAPYSYGRYDEALVEIAKLKPACVIVDSISHAHDGPGGMIEEHDADVERRAGDDYKKRDRVTWAAWIKPKQAEGKFIYRMLSMDCPIILCFRAKEKLKIVPGKEPVDLGYQPIASERIAFETIFSLMLPPRSKGVPDLALSDMREPFDDIVRPGQAIDESLGERLAAWSAGGGLDRMQTADALVAANRMAITGSPVAPPDDALLIKAREWAECGTEKYAAFWQGLTTEQRKAIGAIRHESFKAIAANEGPAGRSV